MARALLKPHRFRFLGLLVVVATAAIGALSGQITPEEHASHHPGAAAPGAPTTPPAQGTLPPSPGMPGAAPAPGGTNPSPPTGMAMPPAGDPAAVAGGGMAGPRPAAAGGMAAGMGEMMKQMGVPPRKELYPSLMAMPPLTPEKRAEVEQLAHERMKAGAALMSSGLEKMGGSTSDEDYLKMQDAAALVRQGILQFESGLAAHRALSGGEAPRNVALEWFKRDMNLLPFRTSSLHTDCSGFPGFTTLRWRCSSRSRSRCSPCTSSRCAVPQPYLGGWSPIQAGHPLGHPRHSAAQPDFRPQAPLIRRRHLERRL